MQNKMDFTLSAYKQLISTLQSQGFYFQTFEEYIKKPKVKVVILRHDVDRKPGNALVIAKIEKEAGIKASYYFRIVKKSYDEDVIKQIAEMGHEIGYHYENLSDPQITQIDADYLIGHRRRNRLRISQGRQTHTDSHRRFSRATPVPTGQACSDKNSHRFGKRQRSPVFAFGYAVAGRSEDGKGQMSETGSRRSAMGDAVTF